MTEDKLRKADDLLFRIRKLNNLILKAEIDKEASSDAEILVSPKYFNLESYRYSITEDIKTLKKEFDDL